MVIQEQMFGYSAVQVPARKPARRRSRASGASLVRPTLQEALAPYLDVERLEEILVARGRSQEEISLGDLQLALKGASAPPELQAMLTVLAAAMRPPELRKQIKSPADAAALLMVEMGMLDQEHLRVVLLDTKNRVMGIEIVYRGSLNSAAIRIGEVFKPAIRVNAAAIILCHNHPSGAADPSPEDILVTRQIVEAGKLFDTECVDHLVIGSGQYVSLRQRGLGFSC
jgi:DNA repair protein RadC